MKILRKHNLLLTLSIFSIFVLNAHASSARVGLAYTTADGLWIGDKETDFKDAPGATSEGTRTILQYTVGTNYDLAKDKSLSFNLTYSEAKMNDTGVADVAADSSRRGISEIALTYMQNITKQFVKTDIGFGARLPGDNKSPDTFIALNDGFAKYDMHLNLSKSLGVIDIGLNNRYTIRPQGHNQHLTSLNLSRFITKKIYLGIGYTNFNTIDGTDIGGPGFGINGAPGFSRVKETYKLVSLTGVLLLKDKVIDVSFATKTEGQNTDMSNTFSVGLSKYY